ncbi:lipopolysaccharide biosynthesis protein [Nostoc spongiaeforme FACHB-130]|uniref:Lipopolysaccharide biosynthesis protein n=1 Tax=Nostoc spongiaeforme FACHB-130 TaxID=1357510 RepID=A0ABR8FU51_9NOSO|nr:lipopolysaccharide biosynthesis protein [Nostoc spongiaeforme]MBD2594945.1 lipopolysaccharide biosynthesis protein [Nostoc spongiaeforme FACHB-130]
MEPPKQTSNLRQKAVKGVLWSAIESWGKQAVSFGVFFLLARLLGPEAFGLVALSGIFLSFLQIFVDQGFSTAIVQRQDLEPEHLDTAFWTNLGVSILLTTISISCAGLVASFFKEPHLIPIIRCLSLNFVFGGLSGVQQSILQRELAFKILAVRSLVAVLVGGSVGIVLAFLGFGVWSIVGQSLANSIAQVITLWWVSSWRPRFKFSQKHFKELFTFGINIVGINVLNFVNQNSDNFLIGYFLGSVALGYYAVAYRILTVVTQLMISVIQKIAMPIFSRMQKEPEKMLKAFYKAVNLTSLGAFPIFIGISVLSPELILALFGKEWMPSIPVIQILALVGLLYAGFYYNGTVIMALGKPSWNLALNCIQAIANLTCFLIAVHWGIVAVAASYVVRGYIMSPVPILVIKKLIPLKISTYLRQYITPAVGSLIMVMCILSVKHFLAGVLHLYVLIFLCIVTGATTYIGIVLLIEPKLYQQINSILTTFSPKFSTKK